jgi:hypothetical protein
MKTVVNSEQVTHLWANKVQSNARNATGSLFFNDSNIFSYGSHFLIAKHVTNAGGQNAVLFTTADYSKTTEQHKYWVRQSIPSAVQVFKIDLNRRFDHVTDDIVMEYNQRKEVILGKALRARSNRKWYLQEVQSLHLETLRFVNFFGFDSALVTPLGFDAANVASHCRWTSRDITRSHFPSIARGQGFASGPLSSGIRSGVEDERPCG